MGVEAHPWPAERPHEPAAAPDLFVAVELPTTMGADAVGWLRQRIGALEAAGTHWQEAFLATHGRRLLCRFRGFPAAALGDALNGAGLRIGGSWSGAVRDLADAAAANVVVERSGADGPAPDASPVTHQDMCLANHRVSPVRLVTLPDRRHLLAFYHAPDAESVRLAQRHGSVPAGRVWACRPVDTR
jgi:hypothetical protein